ncbi:hypothetical protein PORCRE_908 [Porphyromonas crevioricanis JCM 15906]|uniref:Uncharacterized protein n=1 Tax=Porphyromonas crevioricanis JCM 15906 TaxID=1305617 RepID=T1CQ35_9PORP|nr:hypothetical protein PORCRE_908 [Porphyromonas crevioricanis JCM 15906]GAD06458.1 hypothetical protein PORCAN_54 [Porphyromonas crevioricanis JCM 13913]
MHKNNPSLSLVSVSIGQSCRQRVLRAIFSTFVLQRGATT